MQNNAYLGISGNHDIDINLKTFRLVVDITVVRLSLSIDIQKRLYVEQLDYMNAFVLADIDREVYMYLSELLDGDRSRDTCLL